MDFEGGASEIPIAQAVLSRYDRSVAATLFEPVWAFIRSQPLRGEHCELSSATILALGCLDPVDAVNQPERRWMGIWRFHSGCGIAMYEEVFREL